MTARVLTLQLHSMGTPYIAAQPLLAYYIETKRPMVFTASISMLCWASVGKGEEQDRLEGRRAQTLSFPMDHCRMGGRTE
jgi:hypothetical protein